jgi:NADH-quinone oxidoreductase subunit L
MFLIYQTFGSLEFGVVFSAAAAMPADDATVTAIALLLFVGAVGKSAQLPLHTWLPDAMAGPTPVSALIHAATMVTAGVYMVVRANVLYSLSGASGETVAAVGVATALFAASIGLRQNDIKKVLAYSTVSQLGFMFAAAGLGAYNAAVFHLVTHAFFKALLFLSAGSVIHALHGEQDIVRMGGLRRLIPATHAAFLAGVLAIAGLPPLAGFFSKDEILAMAWTQSAPLFALLAVASVLTALYMFRLYWLVFHGSYRGSAETRAKIHESPPVMTAPLAALAVLAVAGGAIGLPDYLHAPHFLADFLAPVTGAALPGPGHAFEYALAGGSLAAVVLVAWMTYRHFVARNRLPAGEPASGMGRLLANKYYVDELYAAAVTRPLEKLAGLFLYFDERLLGGLVGTVPALTRKSGEALRRLQQGNTGFYLAATVVALLALFLFFILTVKN